MFPTEMADSVVTFLLQNLTKLLAQESKLLGGVENLKNFCGSNIKQKIIFSFKDRCITQSWILNRIKLHTSLSNPSVLPPKVFTSLSLFLFEFSEDCSITQ